MSESIDFTEVESVLLRAAYAAAECTLPLFRTDLTVDNKLASGFDPVTEADRGAERAIRATIEKSFPDHAILGEELGRSGEGRFCWTIDPVDGTRAFIFGIPVWGTLIGFSVDGRAVAGIMSQPFIGEAFLASPGRSYYQRGPTGRALRVSGRTSLANARIATTTPALFDRAGLRANYDRLEQKCLQARYGLDCYAYCLLAAGTIDLIIEVGLQSYDIAALIPIIEEAGGVVGTFEGGRAEGGGSIVAAATAELRDAALESFFATGMA